MKTTFSLLDEPWLPVQLAGGGVTRLGLLELFERSGEIVALAETAPPSLIAEYRLLLAITHRALSRAFGGWKDKDRRRFGHPNSPDRHQIRLPPRAAPPLKTCTASDYTVSASGRSPLSR